MSSNNLLIQQHADGDGGCRLLLADPSMCFLISDLSQPTPRRGQDPNKIKLLGEGRPFVDRLADLSLSFFTSKLDR